MDQEQLAYLGFSHCIGVGPLTFSALYGHFGSAHEAYKAPLQSLTQLIGKKATLLEQFRRHTDLQKLAASIERKTIQIITRADSRFPKNLLEISDSPICLYVKGTIANFDFERGVYIGVVGTRTPTGYGRRLAQQFSYDLARAGCVVVSGLALGIDAISHTAALNAQGKTIAFLGCGVDIVYPPENKSIYDRILAEGGLIISEFPPGQTVMRGLFVARNRLISGISQGVLVVEGAQKSGSLITARYAAEQGKEIFAPPAPITSSLSDAPNLLLKQGAKLVTGVEDILEEFSLIHKGNAKSHALTESERPIFELLMKESLTANEIGEQLKTDITKIISILSLLELKNSIEKVEGERYQIKE